MTLKNWQFNGTAPAGTVNDGVGGNSAPQSHRVTDNATLVAILFQTLPGPLGELRLTVRRFRDDQAFYPVHGSHSVSGDNLNRVWNSHTPLLIGDQIQLIADNSTATYDHEYWVTVWWEVMKSA